MDEPGQKLNIKRRRVDANRRAYEKSKNRQDHVLMRLEKGDAALLDAGCSALGLSRSAFLRIFLAPTLGAVTPHMPAIEAARSKRGQSFAQFLSASIRASLAAESTEPEPSSAADEFDLLFGPPDGET